MTLRVLHHNQCFDGACSAAVFTLFHQTVFATAADYEYVGLEHGATGGIDPARFGPGENAIVDFKYSPSPRLSWWFDHHQSAFPTPADRAHYESTPRPERFFFDPGAISCTGLIARVAERHFGFSTAGLEDLLHWADIIDGARFSSARQAVRMEEPALELAMVIENADTPTLIPRIIPMLTTRPFSAIVAEPFVAERIAPLRARNDAALELIRERVELKDGVIFFDLTDRVVEGLSKFIPYYLHPEATYTVGLTRSGSRVKISIGTNPWTTRPAETLVNLAAVCERFGGGGHARVGAVSLDPDQVEEGRRIAATVVGELRRHERQRQDGPSHS